MKIAILGGSFDPPHIGHILIAQQVKDLLKMDQVWLLPNFKHAFNKSQSPVDYRLEMTKLITEKDIIVSRHEINKEIISYTIDTLSELKNIFPNNKFFWILGSDQLDVFKKYKDWQKILNNYPIIIFPRESVLSEFEEKIKKTLSLSVIPKNIIVMNNSDLVLTNISSSMIRKKVKDDQSIKYLVPKKVEEYIKKKTLYSK